MDIKIENDRVSFHLSDLVEQMSKGALLDVIDRLACQDPVIDEVTNQIVDGYTTLISYASRGGGDVEPRTALDRAARRIAIASSDIAAKEIEALTTALERARADVKAAEAEMDRRVEEGIRRYHVNYGSL